MTYRIVPDEDGMTDEQAEAIAFTANCCSGVAYDTYCKLLSASPALPAAFVDECCRIRSKDARHWQLNERGAYRYNACRDCLKRIEDRTEMRKFLENMFKARIVENSPPPARHRALLAIIDRLTAQATEDGK